MKKLKYMKTLLKNGKNKPFNIKKYVVYLYYQLKKGLKQKVLVGEKMNKKRLEDITTTEVQELVIEKVYSIIADFLYLEKKAIIENNNNIENTFIVIWNDKYNIKISIIENNDIPEYMQVLKIFNNINDRQLIIDSYIKVLDEYLKENNKIEITIQ